jgi:hypothetical protein
MTGPADAGEWPPGAAEEIDHWRQGHVLEGVRPIVLGAREPAVPFWAEAQPVGAEVGGLPLLNEAGGLQSRGMILSQGCEIVKPQFPAVTVAPVYEASNILTEHQRQSALAGQTWHLVHISAEWAREGFWVADLRLEFSVDKSLLLGKAPLEGFAHEASYAKLGERLAALRQRAAVPQPTIDHVITPLREHLTGLREAGGTPLSGVRELRVASNHYTSPSAVTLFVIAEDHAAIDAQLWATAVDAIHANAQENGIAVAGPEITTLWDMSAADYLTSHAIQDADSS